MQQSVVIRAEREADIDRIEQVVVAAFTGHPYSRGTEQKLVAALRQQDALPVSLVAEREGNVVGHIAFSKATIDGKDDGWYGVGPVAVEPGCQNRGIGSQLVRAGLEAVRALGGHGCVLVGEPKYYARFGFIANPDGLRLPGIPPEYFQVLAFDGHSPEGEVQFHPAFDAV